jgi:tRNA dimethylallyltransferase
MSTTNSPKQRNGLNEVALIAGPTASGKSTVALSLADALSRIGRQAWIVNADSMQVYADIPVLSAAPDTQERNLAPHYLYGAWDGSVACSAADWAKQAKSVIAQAHAEGAVPVLVGGTGMYLKVLLEGIAPIPQIDPEIRSLVRALPVEAAHAALAIEDPERAAQLEPGDSQRIARALEVKRSTGVTLGDWQRAKAGGIGDDIDLSALVLLPERQWLYERCDARFEAMMTGGAVEEVEALLSRGLSPELPVMRAIGVPEIAAMLTGETSRDEAIERASQATRNYAKRQYTWFRRQAPQSWVQHETENIVVESVWAQLFQN